MFLIKTARKVLPTRISDATQSRQVLEPVRREVRVLEGTAARYATGTEPQRLRHDRSLNWIVEKMDFGDARSPERILVRAQSRGKSRGLGPVKARRKAYIDGIVGNVGGIARQTETYRSRRVLDEDASSTIRNDIKIDRAKLR